MKRPSDDDGQSASSADDKLEAFFSGFLRRHPRFFVYLGIALAVLIIVGLLIATLSDKTP